MQKKNSKFEREVKSNGNTLLPDRNFFSFTNFFLWTLRNIPCYFFLCPVRIFRIMNANKKLEIREGSQEQWKHTSTPYNFFVSVQFSSENSQSFPNIFYCPFSICRIMNAKKNLEIWEGSQEQWKHTSTPYKFVCLWSKHDANVKIMHLTL